MSTILVQDVYLQYTQVVQSILYEENKKVLEHIQYKSESMLLDR